MLINILMLGYIGIVDLCLEFCCIPRDQGVRSIFKRPTRFQEGVRKPNFKEGIKADN